MYHIKDSNEYYFNYSDYINKSNVYFIESLDPTINNDDKIYSTLLKTSLINNLETTTYTFKILNSTDYYLTSVTIK